MNHRLVEVKLGIIMICFAVGVGVGVGVGADLHAIKMCVDI